MDNHFHVAAIEEPAQLRQNGDSKDGDDDADEGRNGTELACRQGVTYVDIALDGQSHRQPDGRRMERRRNELSQTVVGEAPRVRHPVTVPAERVEVQITRYWPNTWTVKIQKA